MTCSIAVAQTCPIAGDVAANVAEHLERVDLAAAQGAQLVLFPELSLTGYEPGLARSLAFSEDDPRLEPIRATATRRSVTIVVGAPIRIANALHVGAFIIEPGGAVLIYTKQRLGAFDESARVDGVIPPREDSVFAPGSRDPALSIAGMRAAVAICADVGQPAHAARAARAGATLYLASMFVIPSDFAAEESRLSRYAWQHGMVVAMANYGATSGGLSAAGRSSIWSERGELLARLGAAGAGIAIASRASTGWRAQAMAAVAADPTTSVP